MSELSHSNRTGRIVMVMKSIKHLAAVGTVTMFAVCGTVAQTNPANTALQPVRDGKVVLPERTTATDSANVTTANLRPARPERPNLPPEVQALLERYKLEARAYLNRQEMLKKQLQGANDKERAVIRGQIRDLQQQWSQHAKALRKEFKDRQPELLQKLPGHRELLDNGRGTTLPAAGDRPRRGED
jgi:hypothetical protein